MLENLFHESSSDNELEEEQEISNDENDQDKENVVFHSNKDAKYLGHARAKSLIERFSKRNEIGTTMIHKTCKTSHSKDTEFDGVREYVRNLTRGNIEENDRKRMGAVASELIQRTGTSLTVFMISDTYLYICMIQGTHFHNLDLTFSVRTLQDSRPDVRNESYSNPSLLYWLKWKNIPRYVTFLYNTFTVSFSRIDLNYFFYLSRRASRNVCNLRYK